MKSIPFLLNCYVTNRNTNISAGVCMVMAARPSPSGSSSPAPHLPLTQRGWGRGQVQTLAQCVCVCFQINVQCVGKHRQPQCLKLRRPLVLSRLPVFWPLFVFPSRAAAVARVLNTSKCTVHLMEFGAHFGILVPIPAACCPPPAATPQVSSVLFLCVLCFVGRSARPLSFCPFPSTGRKRSRKQHRPHRSHRSRRSRRSHRLWPCVMLAFLHPQTPPHRRAPRARLSLNPPYSSASSFLDGLSGPPPSRPAFPPPRRPVAAVAPLAPVGAEAGERGAEHATERHVAAAGLLAAARPGLPEGFGEKLGGAIGGGAGLLGRRRGGKGGALLLGEAVFGGGLLGVVLDALEVRESRERRGEDGGEVEVGGRGVRMTCKEAWGRCNNA